MTQDTGKPSRRRILGTAAVGVGAGLALGLSGGVVLGQSSSPPPPPRIEGRRASAAPPRSPLRARAARSASAAGASISANRSKTRSRRPAAMHFMCPPTC